MQQLIIGQPELLTGRLPPNNTPAVGGEDNTEGCLVQHYDANRSHGLRVVCLLTGDSRCIMPYSLENNPPGYYMGNYVISSFETNTPCSRERIPIINRALILPYLIAFD